MTHELDNFFNLSPEPFCIAGIDASFKRVNPAFERTLGWKSGELLNRSFLDFVHPDDRAATRLEIEKLAAGSRCVSIETGFRCANGSEKWLRWTAHRGPEEDLFYAFGQDVTELKQAREGFRLAIESTPNAMIVVDSKGKIAMLNRVTESLFRYDRGELLGQSLEVLVPERLRKTHSGHRKGFFDLPTARPMGSRLDLLARRRDGSEFPIEVGLQPVTLDERSFVISAIVDLTARKQAELRIWRLLKQLELANAGLARLATTDSLTGLHNRRAFEEQLDRDLQVAYRTRSPLSVLLADVDYFKGYNDSYGHPAGDDVLRLVGQLLSSNARGGDFVARYGGEEFAIILPDTDPHGAQVFGERFRVVLEQHSWPKRRLTASFGASTLDNNWGEADRSVRLISEADGALYHSKRQGRNQVTHACSLKMISGDTGTSNRAAR